MAPHPAQPAAESTSPARGEGSRVKASPLARRLAEAQGIDLSSITGSGPGGRIVRADLGDKAGGVAAKPAPAAADPRATSKKKGAVPAPGFSN